MATLHNSDSDRAFLALVERFPLRPIRSEAELDRAIGIVDSLIDQGTLDPDELDYLEVLSDLIEKFEAVEHPIPDVSEAEMLEHLIDARGITQSHLATETGIAESTLSAIRSGKRKMSRSHLIVLARYFKVSPAVFLPS